MSAANQPEPNLRDYLRGKSFKIGFAAMGPDKGYLTDESIDELFALFQADKEAAVREAQQQHTDQIKLIGQKLKKLNAAIIAVDYYLNKPYPDDPRWTPYTRFVGPRLKMLSAAVFNNEDIGELAALADSHPQAGKPLTDEEVTKVSLCPTCNSVTHTHDGVCTRCGELKVGEGEGK